MHLDDRKRNQEQEGELTRTERRSEPAWRNARDRLEELCLELSQREALDLAT